MNITQIRPHLPEAAWQKLATGLAMPALLVTPARTLEGTTPAPARLPPALLDEIRQLLGGTQVQSDPAARAAHVTALTDTLRLRQGDTSVVPDAVLTPRKDADVVAVLRLCAKNGIAVGRPHPGGGAYVMLDLSAINRIQTVDTLTGQVQAGAGLNVAALEGNLAARGLMLEDGTNMAGITLASWAGDTRGLRGIRLATPMGLGNIHDDPGLSALLAPFGVITGVQLAIRPRPMPAQSLTWRFPDFAAGLVALHQAAHAEIAMIHPRLSDEQENAFHAGLEPPPSALAFLWRRLNRQNESGALLRTAMTKPDQIRFKAIARRLGARPARPREQMPYQTLGAALLEHGAALDQASCLAPWSHLPVLYAAARTALWAAMTKHTPRKGAHGLVLGTLSAPGRHDARLTLTWVFARKLGEETEQVQAIRASVMAVLAPPPDALVAAARHAAGHALDPDRIIRRD